MGSYLPLCPWWVWRTRRRQRCWTDSAARPDSCSVASSSQSGLSVHHRPPSSARTRYHTTPESTHKHTPVSHHQHIWSHTHTTYLMAYPANQKADSPFQQLLSRVGCLWHHSGRTEPHTPVTHTHITVHYITQALWSCLSYWSGQEVIDQLTFRYLICPRLSAMVTTRMLQWSERNNGSWYYNWLLTGLVRLNVIILQWK